MELKEVYEKLEKVEGGAELITAIKNEITNLNGEAKKHREGKDKAFAKTKSILENLGLEDSDDVADKVKELKTTLDSFAQGGKAPSEVAKQITDLTKQVTTVTKQLADMTKTAEAEKGKRVDATIHSAIVDALTKHKAAAPNDMANLIKGNVFMNEKEVPMYKSGEDIQTVEEGVKGWLEVNKWAVKVEGNPGGGAPAGGKGNDDAFLAGFSK